MICGARSAAKCFQTKAGMPSGARAFVLDNALSALVISWQSNGNLVRGSVPKCELVIWVQGCIILFNELEFLGRVQRHSVRVKYLNPTNCLFAWGKAGGFFYTNKTYVPVVPDQHLPQEHFLA